MTPLPHIARQWSSSGLHHWKQLSTREQFITSAGVVILLLWIIWQGVITPMAERQALAEKKLIASEVQLQKVKLQATQIEKLRSAGVSISPTHNMPMDQAVQQIARQYKLSIQKVQNRGDILEVSLPHGRFDSVMSWLVTLEENHGVRVKNIQLESTGTTGFVEVRRLQLERG
ncbi:type II secretion system protein M [uncultured Endozoicomonas sp.]|uniref:type II secretion system protein M n=1 Tax=uncultured Endozoicomonas sp. TaxID=432652 RepID=UPI0026057A1C|nr:type II secretion system protein M [uncultured Endozoicomonas sp.]